MTGYHIVGLLAGFVLSLLGSYKALGSLSVSTHSSFVVGGGEAFLLIGGGLIIIFLSSKVRWPRWGLKFCLQGKMDDPNVGFLDLKVLAGW